ncbi:hypothetical protein LIER_39461 [Lithospermum erythrorhizon]|uniref:Reverse transcriptase zinc-binding domain-containing protein n=1 Tax=Lithospermum erythrorhizon TaxID=34254 RepID=A0AAV3QF39_LITER
MRVISELGNLVFNSERDVWVWRGNMDGRFTQESQDHLFFACEFFTQFWRMVLEKLGMYRSACEWRQERLWCVEHLRGKYLKRRITLVALMSMVYNVWIERNGWRFGSERHS